MGTSRVGREGGGGREVGRSRLGYGYSSSGEARLLLGGEGFGAVQGGGPAAHKFLTPPPKTEGTDQIDK